MKVAIFIFLALFASPTLSAQLAIIQDPDGWTNLRKAPAGKSDVILKVYENHVFWYDIEDIEEGQEWISIYLPKNDYSLGQHKPDYITGFIHKSRLLPLKGLDLYDGKDFKFEYQLGDFDSTNRYIDRVDGNWIVAIDGRPVWGTDGNLPVIQVNKINFSFDGREFEIHRSLFSDIYELNSIVSIYRKGETFFVHQRNSDGAGAYEIVWVINKSGLQQRLVGRLI